MATEDFLHQWKHKGGCSFTFLYFSCYIIWKQLQWYKNPPVTWQIRGSWLVEPQEAAADWLWFYRIWWQFVSRRFSRLFLYSQKNTGILCSFHITKIHVNCYSSYIQRRNNSCRFSLKEAPGTRLWCLQRSGACKHA